MSNDIFKDGIEFMTAAQQTTDHFNEHQTLLYASLVDEENGELQHAIDEYKEVAALDINDRVVTETKIEIAVDIADAFCDTIVVALHGLYSMGLNPEEVWSIVFKHNMAKFEGELIKNEQGKVTKSKEWKAKNAQEQFQELKSLIEKVI
jgi:predicted HAD superfamily Cof-like phosphohydrolase